ncbi:hypothetical protein TNCV_2048261 [Trichonephila clavipes]|nr:hypothetical protein TNCV_2048261 [Trichonephila clavipes]
MCNNCINHLEKQPSLSIIQKVKQKEQFSSLERVCVATPPSGSRKQQKTGTKALKDWTEHGFVSFSSSKACTA